MKALLIRPGALGDTLLLLPAIAALGSSVDIFLAARSPGLQILRPHVSLAMDYEGPGWHGLYVEEPAETPIPVPPADLAVAFLTDPGGRAAVNLRACLPGAPVFLFPPFPAEGEKVHVSFYLARRLEKAGLPIDAHRMMKETAGAALLRKGLPVRGKGILFHPGSGSPKKNHSPAFWRLLAGEVVKRFPDQGFGALLGPAEEPDFPYYEENLAGKGLSLIRSPSIQELSELLSKAAVYIGHDSGVAHLSAMLGTPTVALFKGSDVCKWRPLGPSVRIVESRGEDPTLLRRAVEAVGRFL